MGMPFLKTFPIAMKSHDHTTIDISCSHEGRRHVKVLAYYAVERSVCLFVGIVGSSVGKCPKLFLADRVVKHRGVMPLD